MMKAKLNFKVLEIRIVDVLLTSMVVLGSVYYTSLSFYGVFNPFFYFASLLFNNLNNKQGFPVTLNEYLTYFNGLDLSRFEYLFQFGILSIMIFALLCLTFYVTINCAGYVSEVIKINYIKYRFGSAFLLAFKKVLRKRESLGNMKSRLSGEEQSFKDAEYKHYEEWKRFYKSDLTFDEWKSKILRTKGI